MADTYNILYKIIEDLFIDYSGDLFHDPKNSDIKRQLLYDKMIDDLQFIIRTHHMDSCIITHVQYSYEHKIWIIGKRFTLSEDTLCNNSDLCKLARSICDHLQEVARK